MCGADCRFVYHERGLRSIAAFFEFGVRMSSLDEAVVATGEAFVAERLDLFPDGVVVSAPTVTGDYKGYGTLQICGRT